MMDVYRTSDLALAAWLRCNGVRHFTMEFIEMTEKGRDDYAEWVYQATPRFTTLLDDYQKGDALVEPRRYNGYLRQVRNELYAFMRLEDPPTEDNAA